MHQRIFSRAGRGDQVVEHKVTVNLDVTINRAVKVNRTVNVGQHMTQGAQQSGGSFNFSRVQTALQNVASSLSSLL